MDNVEISLLATFTTLRWEAGLNDDDYELLYVMKMAGPFPFNG
jgi:hypothetical protein